VPTGVPDRDAVGFPGLPWPHGGCLVGDDAEIARRGGAGVLNQREGVQIDDAGAELAVLLRGGRIVLVRALALGGIVEGPVLHLALTALHESASSLVPARDVGCVVHPREVYVRIRHGEVRAHAIEAQRATRALEGEGVVGSDCLAVDDPLIHTPEVAVLEG